MSYTRHSDAVWYGIREDHRAGYSFARLAGHYGVAETTIRDRARREGWEPERDRPPPMLSTIDGEWDPSEDTEPMRPPVAVISDAYRHADLAMRRGRLTEAQRYLSIAKSFERLLRRDKLTIALDRYWAVQEQLLLDAPDGGDRHVSPDSPDPQAESTPHAPEPAAEIEHRAAPSTPNPAEAPSAPAPAAPSPPNSPVSPVPWAERQPSLTPPHHTRGWSFTEHHHAPLFVPGGNARPPAPVCRPPDIGIGASEER